MLGGEYAIWLQASLLTIMLGKLGVAQRLSIGSQAVADEKCQCQECPSYCDETGAKHEPVNCRLAAALSFCCNFGVRLDCCSNETLMITNDIGDGFHCPALSTFNRTVLSVCVPVGFVCFVMVVVLFIYQKVRRSRRRQRRRRTSNNSHFERRSSNNASCSSRSSRSSIASHQLPQQRRDSVSIGNNRQQQQPTVVMSPSNLEDSIHINDDVVLRVLQTVNAVPSGGTASAETCFIIQSNVYPPPYTDDRPPPYTDIFPS